MNNPIHSLAMARVMIVALPIALVVGAMLDA